MPRGTWSYGDPGALVLERLSASGLPMASSAPRSVLADVGVTQQALVSWACRRVADGEAEVVLVCGGEAKWRAVRAAKAGDPGLASEQTRPGAVPDELWRPDGEIMSRLEIARGLAVPAREYAVMESALRARLGQSVPEHRDRLAELWSGFSAVAAANPDAWIRTRVRPDVLAHPSAENPMLATPYTKLHCSQWNVDQAAAVLVTSAALARRLGVAQSKLVYPLGAAESNAMVHLPARRDLAACPAVAVAAERLAERTGVEPAGATHVDLYSCFPSAVRIQALELGLEATPALTSTGGMTFAGGPFNNYVLCSLVAVVRALRDDPGSVGLVTSVSGLLTKQALCYLSSAAPAEPFAAVEVGPDALRRTAVLDVVDLAAGVAAGSGPGGSEAGTVAGFTVAHDGGEPVQAIAVVTLDDGRRTVATSADPDLVGAMAAEEWVGRRVRLVGEALCS